MPYHTMIMSNCDFFLYPAKFVLYVTNKHFSDKFNNSWKKSKWLIYRTDFGVNIFLVDIRTCKVAYVSSWNSFVLYIAKSQFSDKFKMAEFVFENFPIYACLSHFTSFILPSRQDNFESFSRDILLKFVLHAANNQSRRSSIMAERFMANNQTIRAAKMYH